MVARLVAATAVMAVALVTAQEPQPPRQPTFRTGLELVRVDVTVIDSSGKPVTNLTADDFAVLEDGVPQRIQTFKLLELNGAEAPGDDLSLTSRYQVASELARDDIRAFLVFWDDYHIPLLPSAVILRDALKRFLREMLAPTDLVAVMTQFTPANAIEFTRDRERLAFDTRLLDGRFRNYTPRNAAEENHLRTMRNVELLRSQVSITALKSAIVQFGTMKEGRKALLYFSREYGFGRDNPQVLRDLVETASDANVAFYLINPDGIRAGGMRFGLLGDLALNTGGEAMQTNTPALALKNAISQSSAVYLLGYSPSPRLDDGKFHEISVKVKGRGLQVRARNGYWAPDAAAKTRAAKATADARANMTPAIDRALGELARLDTPDSAGAKRLVQTILLPDPPNDRLRVEPPKVWRTRRAAEFAAAMGNDPPPPTDDRAFVRTDRLLVRFTLTGEHAEGARIVARLMGARGARLTDLPLTRDGALWTIDLPLGSIARGDYLIAIDAAGGEARAVAYVPIRVISG